MSTSERAIVRSIQAYLATLAPDVMAVNIHGGPRQLSGLPDLLVVRKGAAVFLEVKNATGRLSGRQEYIHSQLRKAGATVAVVRSVSEARDVLGL